MGLNPLAKAAHAAIRDFMDRQTEPSKLSKTDALEVLEELCADIDGRIEALKQEIEEES